MRTVRCNAKTVKMLWLLNVLNICTILYCIRKNLNCWEIESDVKKDK